MGPADSDALPRVASYSGTGASRLACRRQDCHLLWRAVPGTSGRQALSLYGPATPAAFACYRFRPFPFRSPLLWESQLIFVPVSTEMCHFPTFTVHAPMDSERANPDCSGLGCPIRRSQDPLVCSSPGLIAAYHVLHRLSAPRHPPYTLSNLTALIPLPGQQPGKCSRCATLRSGAAGRS